MICSLLRLAFSLYFMLPGFNQVIVWSRSSFIFHCPISFYSVSFTTIYLAILPALDIWVVSRFRCLYVYFYEHCCSEPPCTCLLGPRCTELGVGWLGQRHRNGSVLQDNVRSLFQGSRANMHSAMCAVASVHILVHR